MLHLPGGGVRMGGKEDGRDGGSSSPENPARRVLINFRAPVARTIRLR
jgi:hypothetical protein